MLGRQVALGGPGVAHVGPDELVRRDLLDRVGGPAGVAGEREGRREQVRRQADALEDRRGVVLDVRLEDRAPA